ncbi:hypothetical protein [Sporichthya sp.]|uniref:hypothetical protein n=1 Tax=Sporichthya sp. TaxID=65475 RepID=UPI0017F129F1|nr:hypothetical protein [Sporichthya sp.]MBA3741412.1 hypothetical protein [Sporichthya sp.]
MAIPAAALLGFVGLGSSIAKADSPAVIENYTLSAQAQSLQFLITVPQAPLVSTYEAGAYGSSARIDSLGTSFADAGAPYSPLANSLPGTVNGVGSGSLPPLPPLPGYVSASSPDRPADNQSQGVYAIKAHAEPERAEGSVAMGGALAASEHSTMFSSARTLVNPDGSLGIVASAGADLLNLGGLVDIGNVSSIATMSKRAGEAPVYEVITKLGTVTAAGTGFGAEHALTPDMIDSLNASLKESGITLRFLPATYVYSDGSTNTGSPQRGKAIQSLNSGGLQIDIAREIKDLGLVVTSTTLGQVFLSATADDAGAGSALAPGVLDGLGGGPESGSPASVPGAVADGIGLLPNTIGGLPPTAELATAPSAVTGAAPNAVLSAASAFGLGSAELLYGLLALAAVLALVGTQLVGFLAVRLGRTSA